MTALRELLKIIGYVFVVMVGGAMLAPPLWWLGRWGIDIGLVPGLRPFAFDKYFNRAALVLAIGLLPVLVRSLRIESWQALGLVPNAHRVRDVCLGLCVSVGGFALSVAALTAGGALALEMRGSVRAWSLALLAGAVVGVLEEVLFRGVFLGVMRRSMRAGTALAALSALFASVHFLRPNPALPTLTDITWLSGLHLLPHLLWEYARPARLWASWLTLTVMAWVLGDTVVRTRSLYLAIGLHAGWVFAVKALSLTAIPASRQDFWLGNDWRSGAAPLCVMLTSAVVLRFALRGRTQARDTAGDPVDTLLPQAHAS